eukprot:41846_1
MSFQTGRGDNDIISIKEHKSLMEDQRNHYDTIITNLEEQLMDSTLELEETKQKLYANDPNNDNKTMQKYDLHQSENLSTNRRSSSVILDDLIGMNIDIEDNISEDYNNINSDNSSIDSSESSSNHNHNITKSQLAHNRRATSMIIEDLIGINEDTDTDNDMSSSSSNGPINASYDAINLEQQLLDCQYVDINDIDKLKEIIETLKLELKKSRINTIEIKEETIDLEHELVNERSETQKYKHLLRISQQLENINPDILNQDESDTFIIYNDEEMDRIFQSKLDLIQTLSKEFDKMRDMIKKQQYIHFKILILLFFHIVY